MKIIQIFTCKLSWYVIQPPVTVSLNPKNSYNKMKWMIDNAF